MPSEASQTSQTASPEYIENIEKELKKKGYTYKIHRGEENWFEVEEGIIYFPLFYEAYKIWNNLSHFSSL